MRILLLILIAPFAFLLIIPIGAMLIGIAAGIFGAVVGLLDAAFGLVVALFAGIFGGMFALGILKAFLIVLAVVFIVSRLSRRQETKTTK